MEHEPGDLTYDQILNLEVAARTGAKFLDEEYPEWYQAINLETLNLANAATCVLGQLYGWYGRGAERLGMPFKDNGEAHSLTIERGFVTFRSPYRAWQVLTSAWRKEIEDRREGGIN